MLHKTLRDKICKQTVCKAAGVPCVMLPKGRGDCSRAAPLSPGCLPKTLVNLYCVYGARRS